MNATFETALDYMPDDTLEALQTILALPVPLAIVSQGGEDGPPGAFLLIPQMDTASEQAQQVMDAYRNMGEPENLTGEDRAQMAEAVAERLSRERDDDEDDEDE